MLVVHGHTITDGIDERRNRVGIDTGAYRTGILTAMAMEDERRWVIDTNVAVPKRAAGMH
jgi:serine/threonine protein phosphatase 1